MSTSVQPVTSGSSQTPPVSTPSSAAPTGTNSSAVEEYRFPNDPSIEPWARGKTASEVLGIAKQSVNVIQNHLQTGQPVQQHYSQTQPRNDQGQWNGPPQSGYIQANGHMPQQNGWQPPLDPTEPVTIQQLNQWGSQAIQQSIEPRFASMAQQFASMAYETVRRENPKVFDKYGPEVDAILARLPAEQRTLDAVKWAVKIVKGDHADDLAREYAAQIQAEQNPMLRSNGGAPGTPIAPPSDAVSLQSDKIPEDYRERLKRAGVTESVAKEFCDANGISMKDFVAQFEKQAITEVQQRMFRSNV